MDSSQNESGIYYKSKRGLNDSILSPPKEAQEQQQRQQIKLASHEIQELKQSLRYVELQLQRTRDEKETQSKVIGEGQRDVEKAQEELTKQIRINQQCQRKIDELTQKIQSFNSNQNDLVEKGRFKAGSYMNEINQRDQDIDKMRKELHGVQDELKLLTVSREKFRQQKEIYEEQLKDRSQEVDKLKKKVEEQSRMIDHLCLASKTFNAGQNLNLDISQSMEKAKEDIERAERIAKTTINKSIFMNLGDKQHKLTCEEDPFIKQNTVQDPWQAVGSRDDAYLTDESIPSEVFILIQSYRDKIKGLKGNDTGVYSNSNFSQQVFIIDDFFGEVHRILKDSHMREIARIRNENSVEIMKLRKNLESKLSTYSLSSGSNGDKSPLQSKENFQAQKGKDKFIENEIERQRRILVEENETLKKRLRAAENIITSSVNERAKFMEGASWIAKKAHIHTEKHLNKVQGILGEFSRKAQDCILDQSIFELNGRDVLKLNSWIVSQMEKEMQEVGAGFENMFENVNYHLKEATKNFEKKKE